MNRYYPDGEREMPELYDAQEAADELVSEYENDNARALVKLPWCAVCGVEHEQPPCSDDFPEPGDIRETGR